MCLQNAIEILFHQLQKVIKKIFFIKINYYEKLNYLDR